MRALSVVQTVNTDNESEGEQQNNLKLKTGELDSYFHLKITYQEQLEYEIYDGRTAIFPVVVNDQIVNDSDFVNLDSEYLDQSG